MTAKTFFQKLVAFTKRNLSAMAISFCMIFALSLITAVVVTRMNRNTAQKQIAQPNPEVVVPTNAETMVEFTMPVEGATEGLPYANDHLVKYKTLGKWQTHSAIDLIAMAGTKVVAAYDGTVESTETTSLWGTIVVIDHGNGLKTTYKSLSSEIAVKKGDKVKKGDQIGYVSNSAKAELDQGAHLHFEVTNNGEYEDPYIYLPSSDK